MNDLAKTTAKEEVKILLEKSISDLQKVLLFPKGMSFASFRDIKEMVKVLEEILDEEFQ